MFNIVPKAYRWEIHFCGHCPNPHFLFFDEKNKLICDATFSVEQVTKLPDMVQRAKELDT